jgi:O-antigen ligase/tetratricopeptide (TPR) repeat protein
LSIAVAASGLLVLQLLPLPTMLVEWLAPWRFALGVADGAAWTTMSLVPEQTAISLAVVLGYGGALWLFIQRIRSFDDVWQALRLLALAAIFMAVVAVAQRFSAGGRFLWIYEHPFRSTDLVVQGPFANRNHFASLLAMAIGPLCALLLAGRGQSSVTGSQQTNAKYLHVGGALGGGILLLAIALSGSRGGVAMAALAIGVTIVWCLLRRLIDVRMLAATLSALALMIAFVATQTSSQISNRIDDLASASISRLDAAGMRQAIWTANLSAIAGGGVLGAGAGTHRDVHMAFLPHSIAKPFSHAENSYLQIGTETGWLGLALLALGLLVIVSMLYRAVCRQGEGNEPFALGAVLAGLAVAAAHNLFDFTWYVPACFTSVLLLVACLVAMSSPSPAALSAWREPSRAPGCWKFAASIAGLLLLFTCMLLGQEAMASASWDSYLRLAVRSDRLEAQDARGELRGDRQAAEQYRQWLADQMIGSLQSVLQSHARDHAAHVRYAEVCLREFDRRRRASANRQTLAQLAMTCRDVKFASRDELMAWLERAVGPRDLQLLLAAEQHARVATQLAPVAAAAWVARSQCAFLNPEQPEAVGQFIEQAARLAPHDDAVLFELGLYKSVVGDEQAMIDAWRACYRAEGAYKYRIVEILAGNVAVDQYLQEFEPDWSTLHQVWQKYSQRANPDELRKLLAYAEQVTAAGDAAAIGTARVHAWRWLATMYRDLGDDDRALEGLNRAMQCDANQFGVRFDLAQTLMRAERYREAEQHFRWCLARRPEVTALRQLLEDSTRKQLKQHRSAQASVADILTGNPASHSEGQTPRVAAGATGGRN